jgi:ureidoacrylate peracid hydrolase
MHNVHIKPEHIETVIRRGGKAHSVESLDGPKTALVVVDMQLYFMGEGQPSECPEAREIVPNVNRLAEATAWLDHQGVVFPGQTMTEAAHAA